MQKLRKVFSVVLTLSILLSSSGVVLAVHTCFSKFHRNVSLFQDGSSCCSKQKTNCHKTPDEAVSKACCELKFSYHKVDISSLIQNQQEQIVPPLVAEVFFIDLIPEKTVLSLFINSKSPPEINYGRFLLNKEQRLLI